MLVWNKFENLTKNERLKSFLHISFNIIYVFLSLRFVISLDEDPFELSKIIAPKPFYVTIINRISGVLCQPFDFPSTETIVLALLAYMLFHYGAFLTIPEERKDLIMNKILDACRVTFFLLGTLLLLLAIIRMGVLLYQDLTVGRLTIVTRPPKQ